MNGDNVEHDLAIRLRRDGVCCVYDAKKKFKGVRNSDRDIFWVCNCNFLRVDEQFQHFLVERFGKVGENIRLFCLFTIVRSLNIE